MRCAWNQLMSILPSWLAQEADRYGKEKLEEIRLRLGQGTELYLGSGSIWLNRAASEEDIRFCINTASRYSPWAARTIGQGYLTASGGHRIGICGEAVVQDGRMTGIRYPTSLCIRVARDYPGIGEQAAKLRGSVLLLGPPGSGKTTLLRDMIRWVSGEETVAVVDERGELFPADFSWGKRMDVLNGCSKQEGIERVLRTMGPTAIAVDEITALEDCTALTQAAWCGVRLFATAHAVSAEDLLHRPVYRPLAESKLFEHIIVLNRDKTWKVERMDI